MKSSLLTAACILVLLSARSQEVTKFQTTTFNPNVDSIAEGLVALAMTNPTIRAAENFAGYFDYTYKMSKTAWLNNINIAGNLNEFSIKEGQAAYQYTQYPRYNFGVIIPLGIFVNNPKQAKANYYRFQTAINQIDEEKRTIRREVLINYNDYTTFKKLKELQEQVVHDWEIIYTKDEERFSKGTLPLESFNNTSKMYNESLVAQINLTNSVKTAEAKLEALIGMNIEDAIEQIKVRQNQK